LTTTLILGGARSGKSTFAQELALRSAAPVLFVATAAPGDEEMRQRIIKHQQERPATWQTLEVTTGIASKIAERAGRAQTVIIDCITLLVSNILLPHTTRADEEIDTDLIEEEVKTEINELVNCIRRAPAHFIIVTNEVGLGIVPDNKISRLYRDLLGKANQLLAEHADQVYFLAAGIPVRIKPESNQMS